MKRILLLLILGALVCCKKVTYNQDGFKEPPNPKPFEVELLGSTREKILSQDEPWEAQILGYFNVVNSQSNWAMWYTSWGKAVNSELSGYFCHATSHDGIKWTKGGVGKSNVIFGDGKNAGVIEQFVFYDKSLSKYVLIGAALDKGKVNTLIWKSEDGVKWGDRKVIFDAYYDTQFSVIDKGDRYIIYQRMVVSGKRVMAKSVVSKDFDVIEPPKVILSNNENKVYSHIYNNAAGTLENGNTIFFPTYYDPVSDGFIISVAYLQNDAVFTTSLNITDQLFYDQNIQWGIVCPGLISTGEKDTYWLFYYGSNYSHFNRLKTEGSKTDYYRIKIKITPSKNWSS